MMCAKKFSLAVAVAAAITTPAAFATNGMNLEGYGPVATGMGGASMAYDNGAAATMNNPATIGLMPDKSSRLDVAIGFLQPDITSSMAGMPDAKSGGDRYTMPAVGWVKKDGNVSYGFGMFAQGGMGTEYDASSFMAAGSGEKVRSEVGVGRLIFPVAFNVDSKLTVGGSLDYVWAGMDLKMALSGAQFIDMVPGFGTSTYGMVSGTMITNFGGMVSRTGNNVMQGPGGTIPGSPVNWGRFDFSNTNDFTGQAKGTGLAGKIGVVFKASKDMSLGAVYHSKTSLSDLEAKGATVSFNANVDNAVLTNPPGAPAGAGYTAVTIPVTGTIKVRDFEWPATIGVGMAYQVDKDLMVAADVKRIGWKSVMKDFKMTFEADATQAGLAQGFAGTVMDATMYQNWKDQNVVAFGFGYKVSPPVTLRAGLNLADNPVPDTYMNPLFPAIEKNHVTLGAGFAIDKASSFDASLVHAPEVSVKNGQGVEVKHAQTNWQFMYSARF